MGVTVCLLPDVPSVQTAETLAILGIIAGVMMFLITAMLLGILVLIAEVVLRTKKYFALRQQKKVRNARWTSRSSTGSSASPSSSPYS